jgi:hypothetical protein
VAGYYRKKFLNIEAGSERIIHFHKSLEFFFFISKGLTGEIIVKHKRHKFGDAGQKFQIARRVRVRLYCPEANCTPSALRSTEGQHTIRMHATVSQQFIKLREKLTLFSFGPD